MRLDRRPGASYTFSLLSQDETEAASEWESPEMGRKRWFSMMAAGLAGLSLILSLASAAAQGQGWRSADIGNTLPGQTTIAGGMFTIRGDGYDIYGVADSFRFVYLAGRGDCEIMARLTTQTMTPPVQSGAKAGLMIRQDTTSNTCHALMCRAPALGMAFQNRLIRDGITYNNNSGASAPVPYWIRLRRAGNLFSGFFAPDLSGRPGTWVQQGPSVLIAMTDPVCVGLAVSSRTGPPSGALLTAAFDHVVTTGTHVSGAGFIIGQAVPRR